MAIHLCSINTLFIIFVISALPFAYIISQEINKPPTHVFHYHSIGFFRECTKWDDLNRRFLTSFMEGGIGQVEIPHDFNYSSGAILDEVVLVKDLDLIGNASLGIVIDRPRNRLLVAISDVFGGKYGAVAAYDLSTWRRLFLTQLSGPSERTMADDVAVDEEGNAYVTDIRTNRIWKVSLNGDFLYEIKNPLFVPKEWYRNLIGLNGIVYHPDGYLLVIHTGSGNLYKINIADGNKVKLINVDGSLLFGDGIELLSPTKLIVAGNPTGRLVESSDGWETASVVGKFKGPGYRHGTAATVKDGKIYISHMIGMGYPRKSHALVEAVF